MALSHRLTCRAKSKRSGDRCKNSPLRGKEVCRFHGGRSTGPKTARGKAMVALSHTIKHGLYSKKFKRIEKLSKELIAKSKALTLSTGQKN